VRFRTARDRAEPLMWPLSGGLWLCAVHDRCSAQLA